MGFQEARKPRRGFQEARKPRKGFQEARKPRKGFQEARKSNRGFLKEKELKALSDILIGIKILDQSGDASITINKIEFDSRQIEQGDVFVAVRGTQVDGHDYIAKAIEKGASTIVLEDFPEKEIENLTIIQVEKSHIALGQMACNFYGEPSKELKLVGITGTNGKTTTASLLHELFMDMGYKTGLLSTIENKIGRMVQPSSHTTPDALNLNKLLSEMLESGCEYVFMEVSSHAIEQGRIAGLYFTGGVFTNMSHDHLNYHGTFANYINAKKKFFDALPKTAFALTNIDDKRGSVMLQNTVAKTYSYSLKRLADFRTKVKGNDLTGLELILAGQEVQLRLIGYFNAYNATAVYATSALLGMDSVETLASLSRIASVEGRFDYTIGRDNIMAIVDYAHTPDALEKVLQTIDKLKNGNAMVTTVVGCGGDRDKRKRPIMAKVAADYSDRVILTSDNPRSEVPDVIIQEMEAGVPPYASRKVLSITNRDQAIKTACQMAQKNDIILVAGKGHEKYQEIKGKKFPFDDKSKLREYLS